MFVVKFEPKNETHEEFYTHMFMAIALTQRQIPVAEWDDTIALTKKLKSIGIDTKEKVGSSAVFKLHDEGGIIYLERAEMSLMKEFIKQPIWRATVLERIKDALDFLEACPKAATEAPSPRLEK